MTTNDDDMDPAALQRRLESDKQDSAEEEKPDLPPMTKFAIDFADRKGKRWQGEFIYKVPTLGDMLRIANLKTAQLPAGSPWDANGAMLSEMMCYLEVTLQKPRPKWWSPHLFYSAEVLAKVYAEATAYADRFLGRTPPSGGDEGKAREEEGDAPPGDDDVEREVQPPSQRRETLVSHTSRGSSASDR